MSEWNLVKNGLPTKVGFYLVTIWFESKGDEYAPFGSRIPAILYFDPGLEAFIYTSQRELEKGRRVIAWKEAPWIYEGHDWHLKKSDLPDLDVFRARYSAMFPWAVKEEEE